jgi:hypothetical protein
MLYLFSGDDVKTKHSSYEKFLKTLPKNAERFVISRNNFDPTQIESLYSGQSLFAKISIIVLQDLLEREETREFITKKLKEIRESENHFIFLESKLPKSILEEFKKAKGEVNVFEAPKDKKASPVGLQPREKFDNFLIANTFGSRDKLNTWLYFRKALAGGSSLEELVGILFWKIKDMILKKNFMKFKEVELKNLASQLSCLLPEARSSGKDAETRLEQFLLEAF